MKILKYYFHLTEGTSSQPQHVTLPDGKIIQYTYIPELGNAVSTITAEGITQTFTYDNKTGNLLTACEGDSEIANIWSKNGTIKKETFKHGNAVHQTEHIQTLSGSPLSYTDITGKRTEYNLDVNGRPSRIIDDSLLIDLEYDSLGRLSKQNVSDKSNSTSLHTVIEYDCFGNETMRKITNNLGKTIILSQTQHKNGLLASRTTQNDNVHLRNELFSYDSRNRLHVYSVTGTDLPNDPYHNKITKQVFSYDVLNNIKSIVTTLADNTTDTATYYYNNNNDPTQLTTVKHTHRKYLTEINLSYDANGQMILDEAGRTLTYDVLGRLISVRGQDSKESTYKYNALNQLITQHVPDSDTHDLYYRENVLVNELFTSKNRDDRFIKMNNNCMGVIQQVSNLKIIFIFIFILIDVKII